MASIRGILNIFTREVSRGRDVDVLSGDELIAFIRRCTDPNLIDGGLQQAGAAPFWPQDSQHRLFYHAALQDRPLAARLKLAAERSAQARRAALAHLYAAPAPQLESALPRRHVALAQLVAADANDPDNTRGFMRLLRAPRHLRMHSNQQVMDTMTGWGGDITDALRDPDPAARQRALDAHIIMQIGDLVQLWLQIACEGAVPAALDAALRATMQTAAKDPEHAASAFAALRIEIAAAPRLPAGDRAASMDVAESAAALIRALPALAHEELFTCRDDRALIQRGFGDRLDVHNHVIWLDAPSAALLERLGALLEKRLPHDAGLPVLAADEGEQTAGLVITRAASVRDELGERSAPHEALAEMAVFGRLIAQYGGNRALRQYWDRCEETGVPSRIGAQMGLVLGDMQHVFEQLTRRDRYDSAPDLRRLQDRMLVRALSRDTNAQATPAPLGDSA